MTVWRGCYALDHDIAFVESWADEMIDYPDLAIPELIKRLGSKEYETKLRALGLLEKLNRFSLAKKIEPFLFDENQSFRLEVAWNLIECYGDPVGVPFLLEGMKEAEDHLDAKEHLGLDFQCYAALYKVMNNRNWYNSPDFRINLWGFPDSQQLAEKEELLDECRAWFHENGKYLEFTGKKRDLGFWRINQDAKEAGVPVRVFKRMSKNIREQWSELSSLEREQALKTARKKVGRIIEIIDML